MGTQTLQQPVDELELPETKFSKWVKARSVARVAADMCKLGQDYALTFGAVYQHLRGDTEPRPTKMRGYVRLAAGELTLEDIHEHVERVRAARRA